MHLPAQDTWTSSSPTTDSLTRYTQTDTHRYTLMNRHIHTNTHLTNTYMHTSVIQHTSTHTLIHTHGQAHTIKDTPHLHTPTLTHSICLACLFPMLTLQHLMSAASIFRSCSHVGLSGPIIVLCLEMGVGPTEALAASRPCPQARLLFAGTGSRGLKSPKATLDIVASKWKSPAITTRGVAHSGDALATGGAPDAGTPPYGVL